MAINDDVMRTRAYLHAGVSIDIRLVATAKDIANGANGQHAVVCRRAILKGDLIAQRTLPMDICIGCIGLFCSLVFWMLFHEFSRQRSILHVHIEMRSADHLGLIAATEDRANVRGRDDIYAWILLNFYRRLLASAQGIVLLLRAYRAVALIAID